MDKGVGLTDTKNIKVLEGNHKGKVRTGINNAEQRPETDPTVLQIQLDTGWRSTAEPGLACSRSALELAGEPTGKKLVSLPPPQHQDTFEPVCSQRLLNYMNQV